MVVAVCGDCSVESDLSAPIIQADIIKCMVMYCCEYSLLTKVCFLQPHCVFLFKNGKHCILGAAQTAIILLLHHSSVSEFGAGRRSRFRSRSVRAKEGEVRRIVNIRQLLTCRSDATKDIVSNDRTGFVADRGRSLDVSFNVVESIDESDEASVLRVSKRDAIACDKDQLPVFMLDAPATVHHQVN